VFLALVMLAGSLAPCRTILAGGAAGEVSDGLDRGAGARGESSGKQDPAGRDPAPQAIVEECHEVVRHLMEEFPNSSDPIALMGSVHHQFFNTEEAVRWWRKCLERDPDRADVYHGLGMVAMDKGEYRKAEELWRKARQIDPDLPGVSWRQGRALLELGRTKEAVRALEEQVARSPDKGVYLLDLGKAYVQNGDYQKAVDVCLRARRLLPEGSGLAYTLAQAYARLGKAEKAAEYRKVFQRLRAVDDKEEASRRRVLHQRNDRPERVLAWTLTRAGRIYAAHRRLHKAEALWLRAARLDSTDPACRQSLVSLYLGTRRPGKALPYCRQVLDLQPGSPKALLNTGVVLTVLGRLDEAEAMLRQAVDLDPDRPAALRSLARVLLVQGEDTAEALALAKRLVEQEDTAENYALLAEVCLRAGDRKGARAALDTAQRRNPQHPDCQRVLRLLERESD
jgi:tetratricopeptide (TPR) repeat protein